MQTDPARTSSRSLPDRIHVFGASGTGTTSLGRLISDRHGHQHLDTDDFYWLPTDPPFREKRIPEERLRSLGDAMSKSKGWVLTGSLVGWGDPLLPLFELVVFLSVEPEIRLARLQAREVERYGADAIAPGGRLHEEHRAFMEWATAYGTGGLEVRSRKLHEAWMHQISCPMIQLETSRPTERLLDELERQVSVLYG